MDLRSHFMIAQKDISPSGLRRAYVKWKEDADGKYPKLEELDLLQLNVEIVKLSNGSLGHGWIYYYGEILNTYFPKRNEAPLHISQLLRPGFCWVRNNPQNAIDTIDSRSVNTLSREDQAWPNTQ